MADISTFFQSVGGGQGVIREKKIVVQDADGNDLVILGRLSEGVYGIEIRNANGQTVFKVSDDGQSIPYAYMPWTSVAATYGFTSATYTEIFRCDFTSMGPRVDYDIQADNTGGNMDFEITVSEFGGTAVTVVEVVGATGQYSSNFAIPASALVSGTDPQGRQMSVRILGRRTSGAGSPTLRLNGPLYNRPA